MNYYFDHASTTPMNQEVIQAMNKVMLENYGNPSSVHSFGRLAKKQLNDMRKIVANHLEVKPYEIIFNSGGTEGDNTAIIQTALSRQHLGKHLITTSIEHHAVLHAFEYLEDLGFEVSYLPVNANGELDVLTVKNALREDTILVSVMYVNNEIGTYLPIKEIGELLKEHQAYFHVDAVQAIALEEIHPHALNIDFMAISGHKFNGPKGVGFLFMNENVHIPSFMKGGGQEEKRRAGTENLIGITGLATALEILTPEKKKEHKKVLIQLSTHLLERLTKAEIDFELNGSLINRSPHILNLHLKGVDSALMLMSMDLKGFAISTGSACTAGVVEASHVLEAMYGKDTSVLKESIRISLGHENTLEEVNLLADMIIQLVSRLKQ